MHRIAMRISVHCVLMPAIGSRVLSYQAARGERAHGACEASSTGFVALWLILGYTYHNFVLCFNELNLWAA